jgi:hypothetical protein
MYMAYTVFPKQAILVDGLKILHWVKVIVSPSTWVWVKLGYPNTLDAGSQSMLKKIRSYLTRPTWEGLKTLYHPFSHNVSVHIRNKTGNIISCWEIDHQQSSITKKNPWFDSQNMSQSCLNPNISCLNSLNPILMIVNSPFNCWSPVGQHCFFERRPAATKASGHVAQVVLADLREGASDDPADYRPPKKAVFEWVL